MFALARLMFLNYPNNPTGATADLSFFEKVVELARANQFVVAQDAAYNEMYYEKAPPSILQVPGAKDVAIEFHSLSKTFNMTGWRIGFAIGGAPLDRGLGQVKANTDSGVFTAIQFAGMTALDEYHKPGSADPGTVQGTPRRVPGGAAPNRLAGSDAPGDFLCLDPLPRGIHFGRAVHAAARRGRRRDDAGHRLRPHRRRLHPRRLDSRDARLLEAVERIGKLKL